jgi:hypothetical protein
MASAATIERHEFDVWKCGSCVLLDESGEDVPLKLFARESDFSAPLNGVLFLILSLGQ